MSSRYCFIMYYFVILFHLFVSKFLFKKYTYISNYFVFRNFDFCWIMSWVNLPVYKGFDTFAIWPCQQTVSLIPAISNQAIFYFLRCTAAMDCFPPTLSCLQCLLGIGSLCLFILAINMWHMDQRMLMRYGYKKSHYSSNSYVKVGTFTIFTERPDKLIYYESCFHVMDIKVCLMIVLW